MRQNILFHLVVARTKKNKTKHGKNQTGQFSDGDVAKVEDGKERVYPLNDWPCVCWPGASGRDCGWQQETGAEHRHRPIKHQLWENCCSTVFNNFPSPGKKTIKCDKHFPSVPGIPALGKGQNLMHLAPRLQLPANVTSLVCVSFCELASKWFQNPIMTYCQAFCQNLDFEISSGSSEICSDISFGICSEN